ncbi:MAG: hypothetical protein GY861_16475 [bacterium]|nr:hypothetical protein [bacterium]
MSNIIERMKKLLTPKPVEPTCTVEYPNKNIEHTCMRLRIRLEELQPQIEEREIKYAKELSDRDAKINLLETKLKEVTKMLIQTGGEDE